MSEHLEDILGGVEDEIRLAEERLQQDAFRARRTGVAAGARGPQEGSIFHQESSDEGLSEEIEPFFRRRGLATRRTLRWHEASDGGDSVGEDPPTGMSPARSHIVRGISRHRAWVDLERHDLPGTMKSNDKDSRRERHGGGSRYNKRSAHDREAIVSRLLRERDARLAVRGSGADEGRERNIGIGDGGRAEASLSSETRMPSSHGEILGRSGCSSAMIEEGSGGDGGDGSPSSIRGNIFFASDLVHPDDTNADGLKYEPGADLRVTGAPAASGEAVEAFLLRLRDDENHEDVNDNDDNNDDDNNDDDISSHESSGNDVAIEMRSWGKEDAALMMPPPPPPPHEPNDRHSRGSPHEGLEAGCGVRDRGITYLRQHDSPGRRVAEGRSGRSRIKERGRPAGGTRNSCSVDENDAVATARLEDQLAFRPRAMVRARSSLQQKGKKLRAGSARRIEELARNRQVLYSDRERRRKEMQEEAETKECTFRPNITTSSAAGWGTAAEAGYGSDGASGKRPSLHERLHREAREREAARALAQHHLEKEALRECTFQPTLTAAGGAATTASAADQRPLHQRVWEVERERKHKLRLLVAEKEEREGATFAPPPLGRVSERLVARDARPVAHGEGGSGGGGNGGWLATRLQEQAMWARERRRLRLQEHEEAEVRISTFEPSISQGTKSLVRKRPYLQAPFEQRQAIMDAKRQERELLRRVARAEEETRRLNLSTSRRTEALLRRRMPQRLKETVEERVKRMAAADDQRRRDYVMTQRAKEKLECTFRPSLNPVTQSMGQAAPLDELVNNRRGQRVMERAKAKVRDLQACSHKPILLAEAARLQARAEGGAASGDGGGTSSERRGAATDMYGPGNRYRLSVREPARMTSELRARERDQEQRLNIIREEKEVAEMQRCTFEPQTNSAILRAQGPVLVRGLGRHLELKDIAQQREQERRDREAQAFGVRPGAARRSVLGETVVEPFSLSGENKGWWQERRMKYEAERAAQCTFKPWTVEAERGRALSRLLEWSSILSTQSSRES